jgi:hypothetical protein
MNSQQPLATLMLIIWKATHFSAPRMTSPKDFVGFPTTWTALRKYNPPPPLLPPPQPAPPRFGGSEVAKAFQGLVPGGSLPGAYIVRQTLGESQ